MSLKTKTISGLMWSFSDLIANQGIRAIMQIVLARLLLPEDFGIIGMITIFIVLSQAIVDSGFKNALIRENNSTQEDYSTVFYFNLLMAMLLYLVLFVSAPVISNFFREPQLILMVRVLSLVVLINSFGIIQSTLLIKKINFKTQTKINVISSLIAGLIAIICAYLGFGVWSLVIQNLLMQLIQSLLLCLLNKWIPSLVFSINSFKRLFGFGWKLLASGLINTLYQNLYYLIIGRAFSVVDLGYYTNSRRFSDVAAHSVTTAVQKVSFPVLSSIKENENQLKSGYEKIIKNAVYITFPMMTGLAAVANPLFHLLLGSKWEQSIIYFQILCITGMLYPLHAINLNILHVKGRSDIFLGLEVGKKVLSIMLIAAVLYFKLGVLGLLWVGALNSVLAYLLNSYFSAELLNYSTFDQIKDITPSFASAILMGIIVYFTGLFMPFGNLPTLIIQVLSGVLTFIVLSKVFKIRELDTLYRLFANLVNRT